MRKRKVLIVSVKIVTLLITSMVIIMACKSNDSPDALDKDTSYAFGMLMANQMNGQMGLTDMHFDYTAFMEGFRDFNEARETRLTQEAAIEKINNVISKLQAQYDEEQWLEGSKNREEGETYMKENEGRSAVRTTASGLQYEVISQGNGVRPGPEDVVRVNYEGSLLNGQVFDSSYTRGQPAEFSLNMVIPGWTEGLQLMNEGSTYRFVIPPELAYGPDGAGPIPPSSTLIFTVELLTVVK